ncbi:MAG TPA: type II secretion system minor pseudopilin GspH [Steroidobacteraceae bacterium]|nr:type II secretion system minor pseudopilin GspH [Steroidobacteraceae bacterium]
MTAASPSRARASGFTLLEILVVLVIIGVMVSIATLSIGVLGKDQQVEEESRRVWAVLRQAREEAELQAIDLAIYVAASDYEFLHFDTRRNQWQPIVDDQLYAQRQLPEGLRFRLWLEGREIVLKPALPDRSDKDEHEKAPPQLTVLSSGDVVPFELQIERDGAPALWRVTALADGDLRVEQRKDDREWSLVVQTKPPPLDDKSKERISDARR